MINAPQLLAHAVGDYLLQSDWMAREKTSRLPVALVHALTYSLPFLALRPSLAAWAVIVVTHALIDRYRLARYVVWAKEWLSPAGFLHLAARIGRAPTVTTDEAGAWDTAPGWLDAPGRPAPLSECPTGYAPDKPPWMAVWLLIIADNTLHVAINGAALRWL